MGLIAQLDRNYVAQAKMLGGIVIYNLCLDWSK